MIIAVSTVRVLPGKSEAFETIFQDFVAKVQANEPDTIFYNIGKSREEPNTYRVIEVYKDEAAKALHLRTTYIAATVAALSTCLAVPPQFVLHDTIT